MMKRKERVRLIDRSVLAINDTGRRIEPKTEVWFRSPEHRKWIGSLPCHGCGTREAVEAAHVRRDAHAPMGDKPHDFFCWPGCVLCHENRQHMIGELTWWAQRNVQDPLMFVAKRYGLESPCPKTRAATGQWMETGAWVP